MMRDLAESLLQQMYLWGCDVRSEAGNLLLLHGMQRIERINPGASEGTSRYRMPWESGMIELHGFCAGWYPQDKSLHGVLFIRHRERLDLCAGGEPVTPGEYHGVGGGSTDDLIASSLPFVRWLISYETWIKATMPPDYRTSCWTKYGRLPGTRPWLAPEKALLWLSQFSECPASAPRAKTLRSRSRSLALR